MSKRGSLKYAVLAAGSFGVTLALIGPARLNADGPDQPQGVFATPSTPAVNGVQLTLRLPNTSASPRDAMIEPGKTLAFELVAVNTLDTAAEIPAKIQLSTSDPVQKFSRMGPIYRNTWQSEGTISLKPKETRVVPLLAEIELKPASNLMLQVTSSNAHAGVLVTKPGASPSTMLRLSVKGEPPAIDLNNRGKAPQPAPATRPTVVVANFKLDR